MDVVERLSMARPATLGAAGRLRGITPAALAAILVQLLVIYVLASLLASPLQKLALKVERINLAQVKDSITENAQVAQRFVVDRLPVAGRIVERRRLIRR